MADTRMTLMELAERCEAEAVARLVQYLRSGISSDRLEDAERLLKCAASLRARAQ